MLHSGGASFAMRRALTFCRSAAGGACSRKACAGRAGEVQPGLAEELDHEELHFLEAAWPCELPSNVIPCRLISRQRVFSRSRGVRADRPCSACTDFLAPTTSPGVPQRLVFRGRRQLPQCDQRRSCCSIITARRGPCRQRRLRHCRCLPEAARCRFADPAVRLAGRRPAGYLVRPKDPLEFLRRLRCTARWLVAHDYGLDV